jgi:SAM-dependent methyltransferase
MKCSWGAGRAGWRSLDFADFSEQGPLLDVGCGTGSLAHAMAARWPGRNVIGADVAAPYVAFARSQYKLDNLTFKEADAAKLPYADACFTGVTAQLVLNFVPDAAAALNEIKRVTMPGGRLVAAVWDFRGGLVYQRMFWDTAAGIDGNAGAVRDKLFSGALALPDGLVSLFTTAGLTQVERTSITILAWTTRASMTTGSRSAAARDRSALIWARLLPTCARASSKRWRLPIGPVLPTGRARSRRPRGRCGATSAEHPALYILRDPFECRPCSKSGRSCYNRLPDISCRI